MSLSKEQLDILLESGEINEEEYNILLVELTPSQWVETHICDFDAQAISGAYPSLQLRWYQKEIIDDPTRLRVARLGRQVGKSHVIAADAIYRTITEPGTEAMIVVPYNNQCQIIYDKILRFINSSPYLKDMYDGGTKNPFLVRWKAMNGQTAGAIKIFTAGASSGGDANSLRGQTIKWLYVDEADFIPQSALDSILSVTNRYGDEAKIWISSTPRGARSYFYDLCHNPRWKEFHHPSHVSPTWTTDQDTTMRETLGLTGYTHEILAEFGDREQGVFRKGHIDAAFNANKVIVTEGGNKVGYTYDDIDDMRQNMMTYIIGVDWNSAVFGTQIVLCGVGRDGKVYLLKHREIKGEEFTQTKAIEIIMQWNLIYNPIKIYVDDGFGSMQIETMHRHGKVNPATKLDERVTGVNFSSNIEVWDPITEEMINKYAKGFIIDNVARLLEQGMIILPDDERNTGTSTDKAKLQTALTNYTLVRYSPTGRPVFECEDAEDHKLDAFMLACLAYTQHYKRIADQYFGFKPARPVILEREIKNNSSSYRETSIVRRQLTLGVKPRNDAKQPLFDPSKEDASDYFRKLKLGQAASKIQYSDGTIGRRAPGGARRPSGIRRTGRF